MPKYRTFRNSEILDLDVAVDFFTMTDFYYVYNELIIFDSVHNAVLTLADSITIVAREFLTSNGARVISEFIDTADNALAILLSGNGLELLHGRGFDQDPISSHYVSNP